MIALPHTRAYGQEVVDLVCVAPISEEASQMTVAKLTELGGSQSDEFVFLFVKKLADVLKVLGENVVGQLVNIQVWSDVSCLLYKFQKNLRVGCFVLAKGETRLEPLHAVREGRLALTSVPRVGGDAVLLAQVGTEVRSTLCCIVIDLVINGFSERCFPLVELVKVPVSNVVWRLSLLPHGVHSSRFALDYGCDRLDLDLLNFTCEVLLPKLRS